MNDTGLHVWIGFWTFTCDGTSIDLIVEEIAHRYLGKPLRTSQCWAEYVQIENAQASKLVEDARDLADVYPVPGPYGLDVIRTTPCDVVGHAQSVPFNSFIPRNTVSAYACHAIRTVICNLPACGEWS